MVAPGYFVSIALGSTPGPPLAEALEVGVGVAVGLGVGVGVGVAVGLGEGVAVLPGA